MSIRRSVLIGENSSSARVSADVTIPCLHLSGWYDSFVTQTMDAYERFTTETNADHRLLVGPWYHIPWTQQVGAVDFGDDARNFVDEYQLAWLDFWTKGQTRRSRRSTASTGVRDRQQRLA